MVVGRRKRPFFSLVATSVNCFPSRRDREFREMEELATEGRADQGTALCPRKISVQRAKLSLSAVELRPLSASHSVDASLKQVSYRESPNLTQDNRNRRRLANCHTAAPFTAGLIADGICHARLTHPFSCSTLSRVVRLTKRKKRRKQKEKRGRKHCPGGGRKITRTLDSRTDTTRDHDHLVRRGPSR